MPRAQKQGRPALETPKKAHKRAESLYARVKLRGFEVKLDRSTI
jgi:hypothetical protein